MLRKLEAFAIGLGGPGLFILAFVDSSFIALPEVVDILIVFLVIEHPARWLWYGVMATAGSVAGAFVLYEIARRGGEAFLRKRLSERHVTRGMALFARYGTLALIVPAILPPPVPFKPFMLMAGVAGMPRVRFLTALTIGRSIRYVGLAILSLWYGRATLDYIHANAGRIALWVTIAVVLLGAGYYIYRSRSGRRR